MVSELELITGNAIQLNIKAGVTGIDASLIADKVTYLEILTLILFFIFIFILTKLMKKKKNLK